MISRSSLLSLFAAMLYLGSIQSHAMPIDLLLESNDDSGAGNELFLANFDGYQSLIDATINSSSFSQLNINSNFSSGGLAFDGSSYQLLLESDVDGNAGNEVFLASFDSFQSLLDGTVASSSFSQLNINPNFSAGGLAFDGSSYQLLLESDVDSGAGNEIFLAGFDSFQSLLDGTVASSSFSQLNINSNFSAGGLAFDGSSYQLLLESDMDSGAGNEIFLASFDDFQDLLDGIIADSSFSQLNINSNFSAGGLVAYVPDGPVEVPEPASWALLMFGLGTLMLRRRRTR
ncbi:PEP-CTERM sorting domain-containing protein [Marinobacter segnicrescens]|mgnify:CR=1 FL=1|uniref:PEP-CTERM protein-sorting domain-containing protein n=1 Tax=Marinobacter segnicrescens TaxID=430453 RepID=A0A1I0GSN3_9GAMM|nr:PEP-CTERM sorting domain-containing protein [Marinobacter segnicrescens]SET74336.1 PEP-CTERM protein-sorting domain-containing protein [Marinobacter segnicrescens]